MQTNYSEITETPDIGASREQLSMLYTRYRFASEFCKNKDVLEIACGAGLGLGYLEKFAKKVVGGDIDEKNLQYATAYYKKRSNIELKKLDAHQLPFSDNSFDVIILFEAIYYLKNLDQFLTECRRVLRKSGTLLVCSANREWADFNPSPFSIHYHSATELFLLFQKHQFEVELFGGFAIHNNSFKKKLTSFIKRTAVTLHLIPKTMKKKEFLKRIFFGKLTQLPAEVSDGIANYAKPTPIDPSQSHVNYKVIYVKGRIY